MSMGPSPQGWPRGRTGPHSSVGEAWVDGLSLTSTLRVLIHVVQEAKRKAREEAVRIARLIFLIPDESTHLLIFWIDAPPHSHSCCCCVQGAKGKGRVARKVRRDGVGNNHFRDTCAVINPSGSALRKVISCVC